MGIAVRATTAQVDDSVSSVSIARPTGTADWDGMLLICTKSESGVPDTFACTGFTTMGSVFNGASVEGKVLYRIASGEPANYTVTTPTATAIVVFMLALVGAHPTPTGINVVDDSGSGTTVVAPDIGSGSNPAVGDLDVRCFGATHGSGALDLSTPSGGWTEHHDTESTAAGFKIHVSLCTRVVTAAGAQGTATSTASTSPTFGWTAISLAIAQDPSFPPLPPRRGPNFRR